MTIYVINASRLPRHLIEISDSDRVTLRNIKFIVLDGRFRGSCIALLGCGVVEIKNCFFTGMSSSHMLLDGCQQISIDGVVVTGLFNGMQLGSGTGIFINNGDDAPDKYKRHRGQLSTNPKDLQHLSLTNCHFMFVPGVKINRNIDAVLIHSASNGYISNSTFIQWEENAALDISHRRLDAAYCNRTFVVRDCTFSQCSYAKSVGCSVESNVIHWQNNMFVDTPLADYHSGYSVNFTENYCLGTESVKRVMALWGIGGPLVFWKNTVMGPFYAGIFNVGRIGSIADAMWISSDENTFIISPYTPFLAGSNTARENLLEWQRRGNDTHSSVNRISLSPK